MSEMQTTSVRITEAQKSYLDNHDISLSQFVRDAIDRHRDADGDEEYLKRELEQKRAKHDDLKSQFSTLEAEIEALEEQLENMQTVDDGRARDLIETVEDAVQTFTPDQLDPDSGTLQKWANNTDYDADTLAEVAHECVELNEDTSDKYEPSNASSLARSLTEDEQVAIEDWASDHFSDD